MSSNLRMVHAILGIRASLKRFEAAGRLSFRCLLRLALAEERIPR